MPNIQKQGDLIKHSDELTTPTTSRNSSISSSVSSAAITDNSDRSFISNVTGYEDELFNLKQLLDSEQPSGYWKTNNQFTRTIKNQESELENSRTAILDLDKELQNQQLTNRELRSQNECQSMELQSLQSVNESLKQKVAQQYCTYQELNSNFANVKKLMDVLHGDLDLTKKSESWYKDELHRCQHMKSEYHKRMKDIENQKCDASNQILCLQTELKQLTRHFQEVNEKVQEQTTEIKQMHSASQMRNQERPNDDNAITEISCDECLAAKHLNEDLQQNLSNVSRSLASTLDRNITIEQENRELLSQVAILNETVSDKEALIQILEEHLKKCNLSKKNLEDLFSQATLEINTLNSKLLTATVDFDTLKQDFAHSAKKCEHFLIDLDLLKQELNASNLLNKDLQESKLTAQKCVEELQKAKHELEKATTLHKNHLKSFNHLQKINEHLTYELDNCKHLIEQYENEKLRIERNILQYQQSSLSDRRKYTLIEMEKKELATKLTNLNEQLHSVTSFSINSNDKLKHMQVLMKVLETEHKEKIKRYEINTRILLKKVNHIFSLFVVCIYNSIIEFFLGN